MSLSGEAVLPPRGAPFGALPDGTAVEEYLLRSPCGIEMRVLTLGATIASLRVPDRDALLDDIVLGHDDVAGYLERSPYFGAVVGRFANRIARGRFTLDGTEHRLATNDGPNHLHGGERGFDKRVWRARPFARDGATGLTLALTSPDGEEGYPGTVEAEVSYALTYGTLTVDYRATSDRATPVNLSQHTYFNLAGAGRGQILDHRLTIDADGFTPIDATQIPTGEVAPVAGTPFDFRTPTAIGARIEADDEQLRHAGGYDHNFVLRAREGGADGRPRNAATLSEPVTGRTLSVATTLPGLQFYSGNFLDGTVVGKRGRRYAHRGGLCLETQGFPNAPNEPRFPSAILRPGERLESRTVFSFGIER